MTQQDRSHKLCDLAGMRTGVRDDRAAPDQPTAVTVRIELTEEVAAFLRQ